MLDLMMAAKKKSSGGNYPSFGIFTHGFGNTGAATATSSRFAMTDLTWSAGSAMKAARSAQGWNSAPTYGIVAGNGNSVMSTTEKYNYGDDTVIDGTTLTTNYFSIGCGNASVGYFSAGSSSQLAICKYTYANDTVVTLGNLGSVQDNSGTGGGNASFGVIYNNSINKINYANDTSGQTTGVTAVTNAAFIGTTSYGLWVNGGNFGMSSYYQTAAKFIYATDTRSTQTGIALNKQGHAGANNTTIGLLHSGWNATGYLTSNDLYTFATAVVTSTTAYGTARRKGSGLSTSPGWY